MTMDNGTFMFTFCSISGNNISILQIFFHITPRKGLGADIYTVQAGVLVFYFFTYAQPNKDRLFNRFPGIVTK